MRDLIERVIAARDRLRPMRLRDDDYFKGAIGAGVDTLADAANALVEAEQAIKDRNELIRDLLEISISHYGHPNDATYGVGLLHAKARAALGCA